MLGCAACAEPGQARRAIRLRVLGTVEATPSVGVSRETFTEDGEAVDQANERFEEIGRRRDGPREGGFPLNCYACGALPRSGLIELM